MFYAETGDHLHELPQFSLLRQLPDRARTDSKQETDPFLFYQVKDFLQPLVFHAAFFFLNFSQIFLKKRQKSMKIFKNLFCIPSKNKNSQIFELFRWELWLRTHFQSRFAGRDLWRISGILLPFTFRNENSLDSPQLEIFT